MFGMQTCHCHTSNIAASKSMTAPVVPCWPMAYLHKSPCRGAQLLGMQRKGVFNNRAAHLLVHIDIAAGVGGYKILALGLRQPLERDDPRAVHALLRIEVRETDQLLVHLRGQQLRLQ